MFKMLYNQAKLMMCIQPISPILVKSGLEAFDPTRPDMEFIRSRVPIGDEVKEVPFIPGSSIKGIIRSHAERILRTLNLQCCDISRKGEDCISWWEKKEKKEKGEAEKEMRYKDHCYACRTFGSTKLASRTRISDANPWKFGAKQEEMKTQIESIHTEERPGVMIDRRRGTAAKGSLFFFEVLTSGSFFAEITLRNYQLWQLALLSLVLRDINEGHQRLGAGKSRGLGKVSVRIEDFEIQQLGALAGDGTKMYGVGKLNSLKKEYDLLEDDEITKTNSLKVETNGFIRTIFKPDPSVSPNTCWEEMATELVKSKNWNKLLEGGKTHD
ncbi:MAG: CRISPR-associated RAMP protein Csx7 [Candidatus Methanofastidiosia archaeon]